MTQDLGPNTTLIGQPGSRLKLQTPVLIVDLDALERNVARMARTCQRHGVSLRPHAKTHKSIHIARMQVDAGAVGVCTATLGEAEVMARGGIANVLITTPVVGPAKIARFLNLNRRVEGLMVVVDNPGNVEALAKAAQSAEQTLRLLVALDVGNRRIGAPDPEQCLSLARQIDCAEKLEFLGIHAYAGILQHIPDYDERVAVAETVNAKIVTLKDLLIEADLEPAIVTGAGTGTHEMDALSGVFTELQTGSYVFTDVEYNAVALCRESARPFESSLFVQTMVVSASHEGFVTTDAGTKRFSTGSAPPQVVSGAPANSVYSFRGDEHGKLDFDDPGFRLPLGSRIELVPGHCDPTVNLHNAYHVVRGDTLVDIWPVDARGAI
ncbi:MAG: DSD1 family PLP-dependent enzyme [Anaerolineae bacterium]|nr:DSD1 family PLP-dependent enzyme [Anaerolineae bacterium]